MKIILSPAKKMIVDTGDVVGLIPVFYGGVPKLVAPSDSLGGVYLHRDQLTEEEAELARSTR